MKFTEGYWLRSERVTASYASQGFYASKTERGMRIVAPERKILSRADAQNISTITIDFIAFAENNILVKARHYEAYEDAEARFDLNGQEVPFEVQITEEEAVMTSGAVKELIVSRRREKSLRAVDSATWAISAMTSSRAPCFRRKTIFPSGLPLIWSRSFP